MSDEDKNNDNVSSLFDAKENNVSGGVVKERVVTYHVTYDHPEGEIVSEDVDGYAAYAPECFMIHDDNMTPLFIVPTSRLRLVRSTTREIDVSAATGEIIKH